jgi:RNA polymerase sigma-70 factor (ECF subfamily)
MTLEDLWNLRAASYQRNLARRLGRETAEDIVSEAFAALAAHHGEPGPDLLHRVIRNKVVDHLRREKAAPDTVPLSGALGAGSFTPHRHALLARDITEALAELPDEEREAWILTELRGLTVRSAADELGVHYATVSRRAEAARAHIERRLT